VTHTRSVGCAGLSFYPTDSHLEYSNLGTLRYLANVPSPSYSRVFRCDPGLPHRAVVTRLRFTLKMGLLPEGYDMECMLRRSGLTAATAQVHETLARVPARPAGGGFDWRLATTEIANAIIDNLRYAYWLECSLPLPNQDGPPARGVYGADVTYTISDSDG
jgi:hypothetical protein